jgi:cellulose synthase/poly-beta-1,6-N-acetylglucosamine synthase-like glycosyltransferase
MSRDVGQFRAFGGRRLSESIFVSVTVCVRDGAQWIDDCMAALCAQSHRPLEIIAVDDGSTDGSTEILQSWHDPEGKAERSNGIQVFVLTQSPIGLSAGRNLALSAAKGEWVAITDIDCRPEATWIEEMVRVCDGQGDELVAAVTGHTVFETGSTRTSRTRADWVAKKYASRPRRASLANGPCSMINRNLLLEVGGFDDAWYHAEDMEVSLRLIQRGGVIIFTSSALVHHVAEDSLSLFLSKRKRDARAHIRIRKRFGRGGVTKDDGTFHRHDFTDDALRIARLLPLMIFGLVVSTWPLHSEASGSLFWNIGIMLTTLLAIIFLQLRIEMLWSMALWIGAIEGQMDALLGRHGHDKPFGRQ